jgi:hypothetical protein
MRVVDRRTIEDEFLADYGSARVRLHKRSSDFARISTKRRYIGEAAESKPSAMTYALAHHPTRMR